MPLIVVGGIRMLAVVLDADADAPEDLDMKAFKVYVNGEEIFTAGVPPTHGEVHGGLALRLLAYSGYETTGIAAAGMDAETGERLHWPVTKVSVGDEVTIRFVETEVADPPATRLPPIGPMASGIGHGGFNPPWPQPPTQGDSP